MIDPHDIVFNPHEHLVVVERELFPRETENEEAKSGSIFKSCVAAPVLFNVCEVEYALNNAVSLAAVFAGLSLERVTDIICYFGYLDVDAATYVRTYCGISGMIWFVISALKAGPAIRVITSSLQSR